ncbi:MAG: hypothetical protein DKINENOH_01698 [bacterium]|nr:hypothetical protein [bacterium]
MATTGLQQNDLDLLRKEKSQASIECLGMAFENDEACREYFGELLQRKLGDPAFRKTEGFPMGETEEIMRLSNPPYYTACPNPFLAGFVQSINKNQNGENDGRQREPFAVDVSEGKSDPIYQAFVYHTKVPPKAIARYIEHYCPADGIVFDGFCGAGMTGVAALQTGRTAILADLAPAATAIAASYTMPPDFQEAEQAAQELIRWLEQNCGWLYQTAHGKAKTPANLDYMIWSEQYRCQQCTNSFSFADVGFDFKMKKPKEKLRCPHCDLRLKADDLERCLDHTGRTIELPARVKYRDSRMKETPVSEVDLAVLRKVDAGEIPYAYPQNWMMNTPPSQNGWGDMWRRGYHAGVWKVTDFYYKRTLWVMAAALHFINQLSVANATRHVLRCTVINSSINLTKMRRAYQGVLPLVLYLPRLRRECNAIRFLADRLQTTLKSLALIPAQRRVFVSTQSSTARFELPDHCVDYIFTDPPFGSNIIYSEVNFLWEAWLGLATNQAPEAIISDKQRKNLPEYQDLMRRCFAEYYRILKPGCWMTVEFHNSRNSVWIAIQEALLQAGFVVADVRTLDKQQMAFKQVVAGGTVKHDLMISAYKPELAVEQRVQLVAGTEASAWEFVRSHLRQLPVFVVQSGRDRAEIVAERQGHQLFDRMVAFHVQRGIMVPLSFAEFLAGLEQRFLSRDGMYFLPEQAAEYDKKRIKVKELLQLELFVSDESSAIQWLKQQFTAKPQTFQELHPQFMKELSGWQKHEQPLELRDLLQQNFLCYDNVSEVPSQIHSYLSSNFKELRHLKKDDPVLRAKAKNRWYVPDPKKAADLERLRERVLLREFEAYQNAKSRTLRVVRLEALRAGFKRAWQERDYRTIITVAQKIPEAVLQEDEKLLMWYDQAKIRSGAEHTHLG